MPEIVKTLRENKKALFNYFVLDRHECGIVLKGSEVKSIRDGRISLEGAYCKIRNGELWLIMADISQYPASGSLNHDPKRNRKLLVHKSEIKRLGNRFKERGLTLIPLKVYLTKKGLIKVDVGLVQGKRKYDKRESIKKRESDRKLHSLKQKRG